MTTQTHSDLPAERRSNEAAERLRDAIWAAPNDLGLYVKDLDAALAAERRATVERIRELLAAADGGHESGWVWPILDEEAAR
jgi:hypothetical protein